MQSNRPVRIAFLLAGALVVCAVAAWVYVGRQDYGVQHLAFDSAVWKKSPAEASASSVRLRMVDDLMMNNELEGMKREQIVELLGEPDDPKTVPEARPSDAQDLRELDMVYHLGRERSPVGVDSNWLVMRVDEKGEVTEAKIARRKE